MGRFSSHDVFGIVLVAILATAFVMAGLSNRIDDPMRFWFGTFGMLPLAAAIVTAAMLFVNSNHNRAALKQSQKEERASRFQKGAELIGSKLDSSALAGCQVISDVALEDPESYRDASLRTLRQLIIDRGLDVIDPLFEPGSTFDGTDAPLLRRSGGVPAAALGAIARTAAKDRWGSTVDEYGRLRLWGVYLSRARIADADFSRTSFVQSLFHRATFFDCIFHDARLKVRKHERLKFVRCDFKDVVISIRSLTGAVIAAPQSSVLFDNCRLQNVTLNGVRLADRDERHQPDVDDLI